MKKRGSLEEYKYSNISKMIFKMLDPESKGEINGEYLIKFLLELGLSLNPQKIKEELLVILRKDPKSFRLKFEDISTLCKGDHKSLQIIKYINEEVAEERLNKNENFRDDEKPIKISEQLEILNKW